MENETIPYCLAKKFSVKQLNVKIIIKDWNIMFFILQLFPNKKNRRNI